MTTVATAIIIPRTSAMDPTIRPILPLLKPEAEALSAVEAEVEALSAVEAEVEVLSAVEAEGH